MEDEVLCGYVGWGDCTEHPTVSRMTRDGLEVMECKERRLCGHPASAHLDNGGPYCGLCLGEYVRAGYRGPNAGHAFAAAPSRTTEEATT